MEARVKSADAPVTEIKGVGRQLCARLEKLGIRTVQDLLFHLPSRYEDRTHRVEMGAARVGERSLYGVNPAYPRRFFSGVAGEVALRGIRMTPRPYLDPAPEGALRVLFAGGSTVQGYPHPKRLAAPSYLQEMLSDLWPDRQVPLGYHKLRTSYSHLFLRRRTLAIQMSGSGT